ncbi:hypothetical protein ACEV8V_22965 [Vibrio parahaemolyticus]|uniref:hypothetical protein n=1 Tax=Vibrio parahaemolyticus TaxID=670 RepID=UPI001120AE8D|nr:hypothetical protein [Vibrio parahaemolyticus]EIN4364571.1 hypothetical protein [Vibrio parahaemolyticus]TOJ42533.1 hypothetical protein CGI38_23495 [Vibrio parahaemolyticus]HCG8844162.1 hypothetical protein [Vibrio parahaemolyticus]HDY7694973.1 hypothetical protein [Vibrio vulnificus]
MDEKPKTLEEYFAWANETLASPFQDDAVGNMYNANIATIRTAVEGHEFFQWLNDKSGQWCEEYIEKNGCELYTSDSVPTLHTKPFQSAIDKSFRFNVLWNGNFPEEPENGWITTANLVASFNDIIRGCLVCKYVDGPSYVTAKLTEYAEELGLENRCYSQERDDGYYAYHFYVKIPVTLFNRDFTAYDTEIEVEIQVTTQLQEVLRSITHKFYEKERSVDTNDVGKWKWDFESGKFKVGYLSHTLHLLESIILESRNAVLGKESGDE